MNATQLQALLVTAFQNRFKVMVYGDPGVGKSDVIDAAAAACGADIVTRHPAIEDPTDPKGMPALCNKGTEAHFLPFGDMRKLLNATKLTVCHLEDFGHAVPTMQAAYMQQLLRREINGKRLPDWVVYVASTNNTQGYTGVGGFLEPVKSRFNAIVRLETSVESWCNWALDHGVASELVAFVRFRPELLSKFVPTKELRNSPSPRGWASVNGWLQAGARDLEVYGGAVGEGAAVEFLAYLDVCGTLPNLDAIIEAPERIEVPTKPGVLFALASGLARKATVANLERIVKYLNRMPTEFNVTCIRDAIRLNKLLTQTPAFVAWAVKHSNVLI